MKRILTLILTSLLCQYSFSQYTYNSAYFANTGNPGGVNSESDAPGQGTWTTIMAGSQAANVWSPTTAIPFTFNFYGNPVTQFKASQNGIVTFDVASALLPNANDNLPSVNLPDNSICFWDEFTATPSTGSNDEIRTNTFGTAPNRQFWITYYSFEMGNPTGSFYYFSIVLEETTNKVYVVDKYSTSTPLTTTVGVQLNNTTAVQFGTNNISAAGNGSANPDNDYWEFEPILLVNDNAGVVSLDNPGIPLTAGMQSVDVTIQNFGLNTLTSANVEWEVGGIAQAPVAYAGAPLASNATAAVNLGMYNFPAGITDIKIWTSSPNGVPDSDNSNDTLELSLCTSLAGNYTIGGATPDFATLSDAVDLLNSCGVSGPVNITFAPGTYAGGVEINEITGASAVNTITFDGLDTTQVTVTHTGSGPNAVFALLGADYITLTNLTIENTGTTDSWGVRLANDANWNTISSNHILMSMTATSDNVGVSASGSATSEFTEGQNANHTRVLNNYIEGGDKSIHFEGQNANRNSDNWFIGNTLTMADETGIYLDDQDSVQIIGNTIFDLRNATTADGIYCFDQMEFIIMENNINVPDYGLYIADGNFDATPIGRGKVINNMIISTGDYGMYLDDFEEADIFHNTSYGKPGIRINDFTGLDIRNNIFAADTDYAFEADETVAAETVNFNLYYAPVTNSLFVKDGTSTYADLALWQAGTPSQNSNSVEGDPGFLAADDLHINGILPNDAGDNSVGVFVDIDGEARPLAPAVTVDMGADEFNPSANDAGVSALVSPSSPFSAGMQSVDIAVENFGISPLNVVNVEWTLNGAPQTPTVYGAAPIAPGGMANVNLGMVNFTGGSVDLKFWTSAPNGVIDQEFSNDTLEITVCTSLAGTYTIGGATPDFANIAEAVDQLSVCGISAPVVINFAPGTYQGGVEIGPINGASSVNTVTFDGLDTTQVTVTHTGSAPNAVFALLRADYITITNLTIENTGGTDSWGVRLADTAEWNTISSNHILMSMTATSDNVGVSASGSATSEFTEGQNANHTRVLNNYIEGGDKSIHFEGQSTNRNSDNWFIGNTLTMADETGIYLDDQDSVQIIGNTIFDLRNATTADGIYCFDQMEFIIMENNINVPDYGLYIADGNFDATPIGRGKVINNMVISTGDYGIYLDDFEEADIFHNTSYGKPGIRINDFTGLDIRNNIFASDNDYAFEADETVAGQTVNFNLYYAPVTNSLFVKDGTSTYADLALWQAGTPSQNSNSVEGDPGFLAADDLHVAGILPNDAGDNSVGVFIDIDGEARPLAPATIVDMGADEFNPPANDAGVSALVSPASPFSAGMQSVDVAVENFGISPLHTVNVEWTLNGAPQTPAVYGAAPIAPGGIANVNLGMVNFTGGSVDLKFWTTAPNGVIDEEFANDTLEITVCTALAGTYTIGGATPDFANIAEAVDQLTVCGISAPVVINFAPGTYTGGVEIGPINGASSVNTVTFDGLDTTQVTVTHTGSAPNAVFALLRADYITITNLTIENTGGTDSWGVRLADTAEWNTISNNHIMMSMTATSDNVGIMASGSATSEFTEGQNANHTRVLNNYIEGGDKSIRFEGQSANRNSDNWFIGNTLTKADESGIYIDDQDSVQIIGNTIFGLRNASFADGIYCFDIMNFVINENSVIVPDYGIYVADGNFDATPVDRGQIINNMVRTTIDYGIYLDDIEDTDIFHNTSYGKPGIRINDFSGLDIRNNIFASDNDYAFETDEAAGAEVVNFNLYYTPASNNLFVKDGTSTYADLALWQAGTPALNLNSVEGDPVFVASDDLHILGVLPNDIGDNTVGVGFDIDGDMRPLTPSTTVDMGADEYAPFNDNVLITELITPLSDCGDSTTNISVVVQSIGLNPVTSLPITANITGTLTTTINNTFTPSINFGESDTFNLGDINTFAGGTYNLEIYTALTGDEDLSNDTADYVLLRTSSFPPTATYAAVCLGDSTYLVGMGDVGEYGWYDSLTGGNLLAVGDTFWTPILTGNTSYFVGYSAATCTDVRTEVSIVVDTLATAAFTASSVEFVATFTDASSANADSVLYSFGDGNMSSDPNPVHTYATVGTYTVCQVAYSFCGTDTSCQLVTITCTAPVAGFSSASTELMATFSDTSSVSDSVMYDFGDGNTSTDPNPMHVYASAGTYTVCQVAYNVCENDTVCQDITITCTAPEAGFGYTSVELTATFSDSAMVADSVKYDFGDGNSSTDPDAVHTYASAGTYTVCQIAYNVCENDTVCEEITITCTTPTAGFAATTFNGLDITFADSSMNADSVLYDFGDGTTSTDLAPIHLYPASGIYTVCQIAYNDCDTDTTCIEVSVIATGINDIAGLSLLNVYPNPNNGVFQIEVEVDFSSELTFEVITMRGKKVFAKDFGLINGTIREGINLQDMSRGVYFARFTIDGQSVTRKLVIE